jgi:MoxR-vWA-beta-propeller ternary system domain bpX4
MTHFFYDTIYQLRTNEEITIYDKILNFSDEDVQLVTDFLEIEYEAEVLNAPNNAPLFDAKAAVWAAKMIYTACQLILYRENKEDELPSLFPSFDHAINAGTIFSADLCLRFLPQVITETKHIDPDDKLINILEAILKQWHFSSIGYNLKTADLNFEIIFGNECLQKLYVDRVIEKKDTAKAALPNIQEKVKEIFGIYGSQFWKELKLENNNE